MANLARQLRQEQATATNNSKAPKKIIKQKKLDFSWGKNNRNYLWSYCLFWFGPYHLQSGIHLPSK